MKEGRVQIWMGMWDLSLPASYFVVKLKYFKKKKKNQDKIIHFYLNPDSKF